MQQRNWTKEGDLLKPYKGFLNKITHSATYTDKDKNKLTIAYSFDPLLKRHEFNFNYAREKISETNILTFPPALDYCFDPVTKEWNAIKLSLNKSCKGFINGLKFIHSFNPLDEIMQEILGPSGVESIEKFKPKAALRRREIIVKDGINFILKEDIVVITKEKKDVKHELKMANQTIAEQAKIIEELSNKVKLMANDAKGNVDPSSVRLFLKLR